MLSERNVRSHVEGHFEIAWYVNVKNGVKPDSAVAVYICNYQTKLTFQVAAKTAGRHHQRLCYMIAK